jgi:hypothetical protein
VRLEHLNGNDNKDYHFLGQDTLWSSKNLPAFWKNMLPPFSEPQPRSPEETQWSPKHNNRYEYVTKLPNLRNDFQERSRQAPHQEHIDVTSDSIRCFTQTVHYILSDDKVK